MEDKRTIIVIEGASGAGKDTTIKELIKRNPKFAKMPSVATRKMREGESQGNPYFFCSKEEFEEKIKTGAVFEYTQLGRDGEYRGMSSDIIDDMLKQGKIPLKDCDNIGVTALKEKYGKKSVLTIFMDIPKEEIAKRLCGRGGCPQDIQSRLDEYESYVKLNKPYYDHIVDKLDLQECVEEIENIICKNTQKCLN
ncbi:MAG: hypothetical protein FWE16_04320 [Firmicutes bacterium]|nr:hypothetical protein [Bacillota bacterium]